MSTLAAREVYTVSHLNACARALLEGSFPLIWVEGEISNFSCPASGHWYFTLKDRQATVRCAMFRGRNARLPGAPENGRHVLLRAQVSLYEGRGEFQLIVEHLEEAGAGALRRAFELLKNKLAAEGLFDVARKRPLPATPRAIGVITSPSGAAVRDIAQVLARRYPLGAVIVYPALVQGVGAAASLAQAIATANQRAECDVLIVARGGGALEDLWAFNEEQVARAISASALPIISGIGHEIDFTIADFVADVRAPTPSAAAELASPDQAAWLQRAHQAQARLARLMRDTLLRAQRRQQELLARLQRQHLQARVQRGAQRLDELTLRLEAAGARGLASRWAILHTAQARLQRHAPGPRLENAQQRLERAAQRARAAWQRRLEQASQRLALAGRALTTVSPLHTLARGYAIVQTAQGTIARNADLIARGEQVTARLAQGTLVCTVIDTQTGAKLE